MNCICIVFVLQSILQSIASVGEAAEKLEELEICFLKKLKHEDSM